MSVTLRRRENKDGTISLLLDIYNKGERKYEWLDNLKLCKPANPADRQSNKENLAIAEKIRVMRAQELAASDYAIITDTGKKTMVTVWMQGYVDSYKKKDKRNMQGVLNRFINFLTEYKKQGLTFAHLTELIISDFQDYLREHSKGEGASSYFSRFKKMVKQAYRQKMLQRNPAGDVKTIQGLAKRKDTLTQEEIELLAKTPTESMDVKRAFLFSCVTGLRWVDVRAVTWDNIDIKEQLMIIKQSKTGKEVLIPLNATAMKLLGDRGPKGIGIFALPSANGANKSLKAWVKRAGIEKKITWHNARHSFGTNLIFNGAAETTAVHLLGHSNMKHIQRYVNTAKELKQRAMDKLNFTYEAHE